MTHHTNKNRMNLIGMKAIGFISLLALIGCSSSDSNDADNMESGQTPALANPQVRFSDCPFDTTETFGTIRCGVLDTYENYESTGPDARMVEVAFGIISATVSPAAVDPIVVFTGGPGGSSLAEYALGIEIESYSGNRDVILVDQRGTGFSRPFLSCDNDDENITACIDRFEQQGVDLSQYRSAVIAQDFKFLRQALEIDQWNVYGESYGPIPGLLYADLDRAGVRSVIFDSSTDNQVDIALADAAAPLNFVSELARQCASETECAARLPDLSGVFIDTFRSLNAEPWVVNVPSIGELEFAGEFLFELMDEVDGVDYSLALDVFASRNADVLIEELSGPGEAGFQIIEANSAALDLLFANLMEVVVQCAAINVENLASSPLPTREQWPDDISNASRNRLFSAYPSFCDSGLVDIEQDLTQLEPRFLDVPALILGGGLDTRVSVQEVQKLSESFESPLFAIAPKSEHVIAYPDMFIDLCVSSIAASFLDNPSGTTDISCLSENIEPFDFDG